MARKCQNRPNTTPSANLTKELSLIAMIFEINLIGGSEGWWVDCGATIHVCYDRSMFKTYTAISEDKKVLLGDHHTNNVAGIGNVELKFTSGKMVILKDVMHTLEMMKNLVSGYLFNKAGFVQNIGADLFTLTKNEIFVGKGEPRRNADMWQKAINDEMESFESNRTWHLVDLPPGCKTIGCKWMLKKKLKPDGTVDKFKAHLVAKGFKQRENVDFFDTYSPVTRITSIRVLIALASIHDLVVHQMDIKTDFLFISRPGDSKATSGYIFSIAGGAVSWKSKKQTVLSQSSMESEIITLATASEETSWLRCLLAEIPLWEKSIPVVLIHCDSTAAIAKVHNRYYNGQYRERLKESDLVRDLTHISFGIGYCSILLQQDWWARRAEKFANIEEFEGMNVRIVLDEGLANPDDFYMLFYAERYPMWLVIKASGAPGHGAKLYDNTAMENLLKSVESVRRFRGAQFITPRVLAENASLRGKIRTIEAIETVTRSQERRTRREMKATSVVASVQ
ncbi:DNA polymerase zeta catalytic subunit-like protein [Tanacetum coccineum]|uniref:DNA polymerase zeta catalytic subunit-like protein n=1 Tax=Tanacetum coccineum TaxID=301880 RepID=A0ABQ5A1W4_9ASTR